MAVLDRALQSGAAAAADRRSGQKGLFDEVEEETTDAAIDLPEVPAWGEKESLAQEKEVLGFYLSSHPLAEYEPTLRTFCPNSSKSILQMEHRSELLMGGMIAAIKFSHTKNPRSPGAPTKYAMWDLDDLEGIARCILWPEQFAQCGQLVQPDAIVAIRGKVDRRPGAEEVNVIVGEVIPIAAPEARFGGGIVIRVAQNGDAERRLEQMRGIVRRHPGPEKLQLRLDPATGGHVFIDSETLKIELNPELRERVDGLLGPGNFHLQSVRPQPAGNGAGNGHGNGRGRRPR